MNIQVEQPRMTGQKTMRVWNNFDLKSLCSTKGLLAKSAKLFKIVFNQKIARRNHIINPVWKFLFLLWEWLKVGKLFEKVLANLWTIKFRAQCLIKTDSKNLILRFVRQENFERQSVGQNFPGTSLIIRYFVT